MNLFYKNFHQNLEEYTRKLFNRANVFKNIRDWIIDAWKFRNRKIKLNNRTLLTGFNLAQECDLIYSGIFTSEQLKKIDKSEYRIVKKLPNKQIVIKRNTVFSLTI